MTEEKNTSSSAQDSDKQQETRDKAQEETQETPESASSEKLKQESDKVRETGDKDKTSAKTEEAPEEKPAEELSEEKKSQLKNYSDLKPGMTVKVHQKILEEGKGGETKERIQVFEGMILAIKGVGVSKTITVRKISEGIGVEKIFPLQLPTIIKIEPVKQARVRRAKLYYLKDSKKRLKERRIKK